MSFYLIHFLEILFLIEIDFCKGGAIQGLVLNFSLYVVIFLNGECVSRTE